MSATSSAPISWVQLNRLTCIGVQDGRLVAVAYWTPEEPGVETDIDAPDGPGDPVVMEAGYYLTRADDPHGEHFAEGQQEPTGEWPEELLWDAGRKFREWGARWPPDDRQRHGRGCNGSGRCANARGRRSCTPSATTRRFARRSRHAAAVGLASERRRGSARSCAPRPRDGRAGGRRVAGGRERRCDPHPLGRPVQAKRDPHL